MPAILVATSSGVNPDIERKTTDIYERHGFTGVFDTNDGDRNMENLPDMTLRWTPACPCHARHWVSVKAARCGRGARRRTPASGIGA
jgi:hypothetical protein